MAGVGLLARLSLRGLRMDFRRSLAVSTLLHATAIGCSLLVVFGARHGDRNKGPESRLVFAEAQPDELYRPEEPEPERSDIDTPELPAAELVPVPEDLPPEPFQPDPQLAQALPDQDWTRVGPEPLEDLRERLAEKRRKQALAEALAAIQPPSKAAATAPSAPRGEDRPLRLVDAPRPEYPRLSLRLAEQGTVLLRIFVGPDGHVSDVELLASSGFARLDDAALAAVRLWRFDPALEDGHAVAGTFDHRVVFVLEEVGHR